MVNSLGCCFWYPVALLSSVALDMSVGPCGVVIERSYPSCLRGIVV